MSNLVGGALNIHTRIYYMITDLRYMNTFSLVLKYIVIIQNVCGTPFWTLEVRMSSADGYSTTKL